MSAETPTRIDTEANWNTPFRIKPDLKTTHVDKTGNKHTTIPIELDSEQVGEVFFWGTHHTSDGNFETPAGPIPVEKANLNGNFVSFSIESAPYSLSVAIKEPNPNFEVKFKINGKTYKGELNGERNIFDRWREQEEEPATQGHLMQPGVSQEFTNMLNGIREAYPTNRPVTLLFGPDQENAFEEATFEFRKS